MLKLPPISDPQRYAGLFVYDFGDHVSVGYTGGEIAMLKRAEAYRGGQAYEVYRVHEAGGFELRGVSDKVLVETDAMAFLRHDATLARRDYDALRSLAQSKPAPIQAELTLVRIYAFEPQNATTLTYPSFAANRISNWLSAADFRGGDHVAVGRTVVSALRGSGVLKIATSQLPTITGYEDRAEEEVIRLANEPLQR